MSKFQIISCKTCGVTFSAIISEHIDADWYKQCAKYMKTGNVKIESVDQFDFNQPVNKCCGKKVKTAIPITNNLFQED